MKIKVCHVVSTLDIGGIERWLLNVAGYLRTTYPAEVQFDFLTLFGGGGRLSADFENLGCNHHSVNFSWQNIGSTIRQLNAVFCKEQYDVVHCHVDYLSGIVLPVAKRAGIPLKINHIHNTHFAFDETSKPIRWLAGRVLKRLCLHATDLQIGCSKASLEAFVGRSFCCTPQIVHFCSTQLKAFREVNNLNINKVKEGFSFSSDSHVIIHVGRHTEAKNLVFMLDALQHLVNLDPKIVLLFAGSGPLTAYLKSVVLDKKLADHVYFLGDRNDIPVLLRTADVLVLPSLYEGLPVAVVEAQAAGVRCLIADHITSEVEIVPNLISRISLSAGAKEWANILQSELNKPAFDKAGALSFVEASPFNLENGCELLLDLYRESLKKIPTLTRP